MKDHQSYILARVRIENRGFQSPCWTWTMSKRGYGYGQSTIRHRGGGNVAAHRIAYAAFRGPIPDGLCIDHLCHNRDCCNPDHLEVVTRGENTRRGNVRRAANGGYPRCVVPKAETRPRSGELAALGRALSSLRSEKSLTIIEIGAVMGRSDEMIRQYLAGSAEPGIFAWLRAIKAWPDLEDRLAYHLRDEAEEAFRAKQRTLPLMRDTREADAA